MGHFLMVSVASSARLYSVVSVCKCSVHIVVFFSSSWNKRRYVCWQAVAIAEYVTLSGGMGWDGMGWDGMGWDGIGWDGMGWDAL